MQLRIDTMTPADWTAVRHIYLQGIATRNATFETQAPAYKKWDLEHLPVGRLVARQNAQIVAWAALSAVSRREVYAGVAEVSVYVAAEAQGQGIGKALLKAVIQASEEAGIWTLQAGIFPENTTSIKLHKAQGFREIGVRKRIAQLEGVWRDVVLLERRSNIVGV